MKITYFGHACLQIEANEKTILFDPFITPNEKAKGIDIDSLKPDFILLTHGHEDHVADAVTIAKNSNATVVSTFEVATWIGNQGIENVYPMNHGGKKDFDFGAVKLVNAVHSSVLPDGSYGGNPCGFLLWLEDKVIYLAGDTALTLDMQLIPRWAKIDLAILPIGDNFTMGVDDAILAADFVQCNQVLGIHYDTFPYIEINQEDALKKFENSQKKLHLLEVGGTLSL